MDLSRHFYTLNFALMGNERVGKSSIVSRLTQESFMEEYCPSWRADLHTYAVESRGRAVDIYLVREELFPF